MRNCFLSKTKEEIRRKLSELYSEPFASYRNILDFDKGYDFFSEDETHMLKYSSKWFNPDKYEQQTMHDKQKHGQEEGASTQTFKVCHDDGNYYRNSSKSESAWKLERLGCSANQLTRDLEKLGRTPYHIGMEGEKFRVVAATLQKCNSPFVRRTFQFTSNGIIETPEGKEDGEHVKIFPIINQTKKGVTQKLVTIRRFRVIKKDGLAGDKSLVPQKIKISNGENPRFLTVRIRPKDRQAYGDGHQKKAASEAAPEVIRLTSSTEEEDFDHNEKVASPSAQTEETDDGEEVVSKSTNDECEGTRDSERKDEAKRAEDKKTDKEDVDSNDTDEASLDYDDCEKRFSSYQSCFGHVRSQQRHTCQFCSKRFLTSKLLREHVRTHHPHQRYGRSGGASEDRIKTATSKFGRTRRVLNIAGLRSKYKML